VTTSVCCCAASSARTSSAGRSSSSPAAHAAHRVRGHVYILSKDEGGRHTPFFNNYRPQFYFRTTDVTGVVTLPEGTEMVMPGDNTEMTVELIQPIAMEEGCGSPSVRVAAPSAPAGHQDHQVVTPSLGRHIRCGILDRLLVVGRPSFTAGRPDAVRSASAGHP
jgi:hypothetical protein